MTLNATHDPARQSWLASANQEGCDFPIQNLPFGVLRHKGGEPQGGVAIGDQAFALRAGLAAGLFSGQAAAAAEAAAGPSLNPFLSLGNGAASALRARLSDLLRADGPERGQVEPMADRLLAPMAELSFELPARIGGFTDFYTSAYHAERGGRAYRPDAPLPPNFKHMPIAYNGRASSICVGGGDIVRPRGQYRDRDGTVRFGPEPNLDFELELGLFIGRGTVQGTPIPIAAASDHVFGYCLLNDWSARAIQRWESAPLGPFLGKTFATSISPWIVTSEALEPFGCPLPARGAGDPQPLPHLLDPADQAGGGIDLALEAMILTPRMRAAGAPPFRLTATHLRHLYWSCAQMVAHHASNGCNFVPGDLIGSGTVSGPTDESRACMAELSNFGTADIALPGGETRRFLADGDEIVLRARARRAGFVAIGFGECRGRVAPPR